MIYIDKNSASWGSCTPDSVAYIDDSTWTANDYNEMGNWSDMMIVEYAELYDQSDCVPPTPIEWVTSNYQTITIGGQDPPS